MLKIQQVSKIYQRKYLLEDLNLEDGKYIRMPYAKVGPDDVDEYLNR